MLMGVNGLTIEFCHWHGLVARVGDQAWVRSDGQYEYNKRKTTRGVSHQPRSALRHGLKTCELNSDTAPHELFGL
jgi:hypothetical protein